MAYSENIRLTLMQAWVNLGSKFVGGNFRSQDMYPGTNRGGHTSVCLCTALSYFMYIHFKRADPSAASLYPCILYSTVFSCLWSYGLRVIEQLERICSSAQIT